MDEFDQDYEVQTVTLLHEPIVHVTIQLIRIVETVFSGKVITAAEKPVENAALELWPSKGTPAYKSDATIPYKPRTDEQGNFQFTLLT